jgi:hypothetical protein
VKASARLDHDIGRIEISNRYPTLLCCELQQPAEVRNTIKFSFTTQPATDLPVFFSTTLMGNIISNMFSSACLDADPHIFQMVDMSIHPRPTPRAAASLEATTLDFSVSLTEKSSIIASKLAAALPVAEPPSIVQTLTA